MSLTKGNQAWGEETWDALERQARRQALEAPTEAAAWEVISRHDRAVLRAYSTSFFIVTRFLPPGKRAMVEAIYAAVRYPDEIVDSFLLPAAERLRRLDEWEAKYEAGLGAGTLTEALDRGVPAFLAGFARVVREAGIPAEHYRSFLEAMRLDVTPRPFATLDHLIESYIYGSAIVVGYFLTYVYGASAEGEFDRALRSARRLGIALQLTNFVRDVAEDERRGRLYLPLEMLRAEGIERLSLADAAQRPALNCVLRRLTAIIEGYYALSLADLDAFAPDCRVAIRACVDVYRQLNDRIAQSPLGVMHRESVPLSRKFRVLPASKYWRLPMAYLRP
ncbi:MAG TPA: phytoene/squalene synthase family protein [Blastocatellia bacterium]|nr:phytoene/squalene synthase family protein [Blastocatellia bacterium]